MSRRAVRCSDRDFVNALRGVLGLEPFGTADAMRERTRTGPGLPVHEDLVLWRRDTGMRDGENG